MTRVIVVGAGIGGLATAMALQPKNVEVAVLEQAPELSKVELGTGVTLWPNAMLVLDKLGVGDTVRERGAILNCFEQRTRGGRLLTRWPTDEMGERIGAPLCGVNRADLHATLAERAGDAVRTGARVAGFTSSGDTVEVNVEGGHGESGDVLIGADGLESVIRKQLLGDTPLRHSGLIMWRATMGRLDPAITPGVDFTAWWGAGAKFIVFRSGPDRWTMEAAVTAPPGEQDPPDQTRLIHERFAGFADPVHAIIDVAGAGPIFRTDVFDRPPDEKWGSGRVTLLGDAAHPMTFAVGQGAAQALEDALAVADAASAPDVEAGLRAYEQRRIPRAAKFQTMAWKLARAGALTTCARPADPATRSSSSPRRSRGGCRSRTWCRRARDGGAGVRVIVVGGGVGGLAAAGGLRAAGIDAAVFEQLDHIGATLVGGGFHLWPNAVRALRELGLDDAARERGAPFDVTEFCSWRGRKLAEWPLKEIADELDLFDVGIGRADLLEVLSGAVDGSQMNAGARLVDFEDEPDGVTARFDDGREERADVLVGADGLRSIVRGKLLGASEPDYAGYVQWQTLVEGSPTSSPPGWSGSRSAQGPGP